MSDDTRQAQAIDVVAKSAIAALAKVLAHARSGQTAMTPDEYWGYLHESYRPDYVRQARLMLESAFAVAPPERHDAPGVTVAWLDEKIYKVEVAQVQSRRSTERQLLIGKRIAYREVRSALLTGQPGAGRDPDAADAGGE